MSRSLQQSFVEDPSLSDRLFELLETVFPGLGLSQLADKARQLGAPWESASVPFMKFEEGREVSPRIIAHVGVLELPLCVMGQPIKVGGIHAVATHPEFRRRGHYRDCMEAALEYCQTRYETLVLNTSQPQLYQPFGFRVVPEYAFVVSCDLSGQKDGFRVLNLQDVNDCALLHRLLETRIPVSEVVGVYSEKAVFLVNEASRQLYYAAELDAIAVMEQEGDRLHLFDVVVDRDISLAEILNCIPHRISEVILYFSPERFHIQAKAIPYLLDDTYLMIRGAFAAEGQPFMLPRSARC